MLNVKKGSEIIAKVFPRSWINNNAYNDLRKELEGTVVVPEETWKKLEKMAYFENTHEGDVLIPQERWERIQQDIANLEGISHHATTENQQLHGKLERIQKLIENNPIGVFYDLSFNFHLRLIGEWFSELRKAMEE